MPIEVCSISGFTKTEGNSVAIKVDDEVILLDMGLSMQDYIKFTEDLEDVSSKTYKSLLKASAVPDYGFIEDWKDKVIAIVPSHGHLDHVGAIPFAAPLFPNATIVGTPYTIEILKSILSDEHIDFSNRLISMNLSSSYKISEKITVEFVNVTHSIPQTAIVILHTPYGKIMYANDFKLDNQPVLGKKPDYERLKKLGEEGIKLLIINCLYAHSHTKCPSESVAREMLKDTMLGVNSKGKAMIVTTFSSHLARLKSIIALGKQLNRKIIFLGRSLDKYVKAGENINIINFSKDIKIFRHRDKVEKILHKIAKEGRDKYLIVCTGHQGEPRAILSRITKGELEFKFKNGDIVIFSCQVIPVDINRENREKLEKTLRKDGVRIFKDVHVSGHGAREDHRDLIEMVTPDHIMPIHAEPEKGKMMAELAASLGYKNTHVMQDGKRLVLK
ncbi:MAG: MBL fold metallo-hydrolase [Nanoarchaeota archaeon]|nr:MBL fold metallo-hydrolase [Nanoarchaeota archaeon]MBU1643868.1 MBL fold metallo-hydrolase [Nanoarchaeota archaeon]MBU1977221.1 MBL fold metallo-hydrolase [Nanoarchaeota archaeon]